MSFSPDETDRYARQVLIPEWGAAGQEALRWSHVAVLGHGVAAEAAVCYLAGAGVGGLAAVDDRLVALARALNPHVQVDEPLPPLVAEHFNPGLASPVMVLISSRKPMMADVQRITGAADRAAVGAACAVEAVKAVLQLAHQTHITLDDGGGHMSTTAIHPQGPVPGQPDPDPPDHSPENPDEPAPDQPGPVEPAPGDPRIGSTLRGSA